MKPNFCKNKFCNPKLYEIHKILGLINVLLAFVARVAQVAKQDSRWISTLVSGDFRSI